MRRNVRHRTWERFLENNDVLDPQDTISRLPETVLQHILSFLPFSTKKRVSFLSRRWRRLCAHDQLILWISKHRLNELELPKILNDELHSVEFLSLKNCSGMRNLKLVNFKLRTIHLYYCGTLKSVYLNTPNLRTLFFHGPRAKPCVIEYNNCKNLLSLRLIGVVMNDMMFKNCNQSFPVLQELTISGCDTSGCINISSNSIEKLSLMRFKNHVGLTIDTPNLLYFCYNGDILLRFQNINFPRLASAKIELYPLNSNDRDMTWFTRLIEMLHCLKYTEKLEIYTDSEENVIIPKELRETFVPPLDRNKCMIVRAKSLCPDVVDLTDSILWISPRVEHIYCLSYFWGFDLKLTHGELSSGTPYDPCSFCISHPSRCWRHSLIKYSSVHFKDESKKELISYIVENLIKARRKNIHLSSYGCLLAPL